MLPYYANYEQPTGQPRSYQEEQQSRGHQTRQQYTGAETNDFTTTSLRTGAAKMGTYHDDTDLVTKVTEIIQNLTEKSRDTGMSSKLDFERKREQRRTISPEHRGSMNTATDGKQASFFYRKQRGKNRQDKAWGNTQREGEDGEHF